MNEEQKEKFIEEINQVGKKYGVTHLSFCATVEDRFLGMIAVGGEGYGDYFESIMNVGRLYQASREKVFNLINDFEGKRK